MSDIELSKSSKNRVFAIFLALYPILCIYKAFGNFTIGDVVLIGFIVVETIKGRTFKNIFPMFIIYGIYILTSQMLDFSFAEDYNITSQINAAIIRAIKILFYIFAIVCLAGSRICNFFTLRRWLIIVGLATSIFMFYQYIMFFGFGKVVLGQIPGLEIYLKEYTTDNLDYEAFYNYTFRPCSLFLEPAMLAQFMIVPIAMLLFSTDEISRKKLYLIIFTLATILSTSGQGVLYLSMVYAIFSFVFTKNKLLSIMIALSIALIGAIGYEFIEPLSSAVDRLVTGEEAQESRFGTYEYCFDLEAWRMLFGNGYGCTHDGLYMAGAAYVWYGAGIIGLFCAILLFVQVYIKCKPILSRALTLLFFAMLWGTALFYNYMFFWFFTIIIVVAYPFVVDSKKKIKHA